MKKLIIGLMSFCMALCMIYMVNARSTSAEDLSFSFDEETTINDTYALNDKLVIPQGHFEKDGKEYKADAIINFPSGNAFLTSEVYLSETGDYTLEYKVEIDGEIYKKLYKFTCLKGLYGVTTQRSSIRFGQPSELGIPFTTEKSAKGLCVSLVNGDTFTYNGVIDLNKCTKDNKAIEFYVTPIKSKTADVFSIYVKFTDIYDPNNYVMVSIWSYNMKDYAGSNCRAAYITACVPSVGQSYTGHYTTYQSTGAGYVDAIFKSMRTSGFCSFMSLYGDNANGPVTWIGSVPSTYATSEPGFQVAYGTDECYAGVNKVGFWWNYDELQLKSNQPLNWLEARGGSLDYVETVADFDSAAYYQSPWSGFTTGECYMSVWADDYQNSSFNFVITECDGEDFENGATPETYYLDDQAPQIKLNYSGYSKESIPAAKVGCEYPIFKANAVDGNDGSVSYSTKVYYGYGTSNQYEVSSLGGTFTPDREGKFTIVYKTRDASGNVKEELVEVNAYNSATTLSFSCDTKDAQKIGNVGEIIRIPSASYSGGVGLITYSATATNGNKTYDASNGSFRPLESGTYTIRIEARDFIGQTEYETYTIAIKDTTAPVFSKEPTLPKYLFSGYTYNLESLEVEGATVKAYAKVGGVETELKDFVFDTSSIEEDTVVEIIYKAENGNGVSTLAYEIPLTYAKSGKNGTDLTKYFDTVNATAVASSADILLKADSAGKASATWKNMVLAQDFSSIFKIKGGEMTSLSMILSDAYNDNIKVKFTWNNVNGTIYTYINNYQSTITTTMDFQGENATNFIYDNETCTFLDKNTQLSEVITSTLNGAKFTGFPSGYVYVTFEMDGCSGDAGISFTSLSSQVLKTNTRDAITPEIKFMGSAYPTKAYTGTYVTLRDFLAADGIAPVVFSYLTVTDPDGEIVSTTSGTKLDGYTEGDCYGTFVLSKAGTYTLTYTIHDENSMKDLVVTFVISVQNLSTVTLKVNGEIASEMKVGETLTLPTATVTTLNGTCNYYIMLVDTQIYMSKLSMNAGTTFTPTKAGTYKIIYYGIDSEANSVMVQYTITVTE